MDTNTSYLITGKDDSIKYITEKFLWNKYLKKIKGSRRVDNSFANSSEVKCLFSSILLLHEH